MKSPKMFLVSLAIALTFGTLIGTALASSCTCSDPNDECGSSSTNCCGCADYVSSCTTCDEDETCDTSSAVYYEGKGWWRSASCKDKC
jgi:hypothetical protein